jgi:hypothetical protein
MHMDHLEYPDLIDDHLSERILGNVCSVLEPSDNRLKGSRCLRWFCNIQKHRVMIYERGNSKSDSFDGV